MRKIWLIRHGKTAANEGRLYCGSTDLPLSENGREALRDLHYDVSPDALFITSGMLRTEQTLALLFGEKVHQIEPRLREIDFGAFEMLDYEQLKDRADFQSWISGDNEKNRTPGGESGEEMAVRACAAFDELLRTESRDLVIITHGGVIAALMAAQFPNAGRSRYEWQPKPGHGYLLTEDGYMAIP